MNENRKYVGCTRYGVHTVDIADELAQLDPDGYRPLRRPPRAPPKRWFYAGYSREAD
jgi:hypothetical protein